MIQNEMRKFLIRNSIITYTMCAIAIVALLLNFLTNVKSIEESRKYLYMIRTDGEIVPLEWINRRENISVEIKHHIYLFVKNFYDLEQSLWKEGVEKALWLGDLKQLHIRRQNDGYYNRFIQFSIEQTTTIQPEDIELYGEDGMNFRVMINLAEKQGGQNLYYVIFAKGTIRTTVRSGQNPHGLYIENYLEEKVIKKEDE